MRSKYQDRQVSAILRDPSVLLREMLLHVEIPSYCISIAK